MIIFNGIKVKNKIPYLIFANDNGKIIEIPIDSITSDRISKYLTQITPLLNQNIIHENDQESS